MDRLRSGSALAQGSVRAQAPGVMAARVRAMASAPDRAPALDRVWASVQAVLEQASAQAEMESETYPTRRRPISGPTRSQRQSRI